MKFSGPDLMASQFQVDIIAVSKNVFTEDVLRCAATRLLDSWPMLSFRTNFVRSCAVEIPAKSVDDGFLNIRMDDQNVLPDLTGTITSPGITTYDSKTLHNVFTKSKRSWHDTLCSRIFAIEVVILRDATVFKFMMQHAAGDAIAMYNAANAFCEGLHGEIPQRTTDTDRQYRIAGHEKPTPGKQSPNSTLRTQQAREWWDMCTGSKLFPVLTLARKWWTAMSHDTQWRTIHLSNSVVSEWRKLASNAGVKVTEFDLLASWIQLNLAEFAHSIDPDVPERLAFSVSMRRVLENPHGPENEIRNPVSIAVVPPFPKTPATKQSKLVNGAVNIRSTINATRDPAYALDYADLMAKTPRRQAQIRKMGKRSPASMLLTSWSHAPFGDLEAWSDPANHTRETNFLQPVIGCIPSAPVPGRSTMDPQVGVVWRGKDGDGYWFTAKIEESLWRGIMDVSF